MSRMKIIIDAMGGDNAPGGALRFERDLLSYNPDLAVISFGLNDSVGGREGIAKYTEALEKMFSALRERGIEVIFLTENTMCTETSPHLKEDKLISLSRTFSEVQNSGMLTEYFNAAKELCGEYGVRVCDLHSVWLSMIGAGINTTELLANKLNHPIRAIHYYMAMKIVETMLG